VNRLRQIPKAVLVVAVASCALAGAAPADAARVLVFDEGRVRASDDRALDGLAQAGAKAAAPASCCARGDRARARAAASGDPVKRALRRALAACQIDAAASSRYRSIYARALSVYRKLGFQRRRELGDVIDTLRRIARAEQLSAARLPALFLTLDNNRQWWGAKGPPAANTRVRFGKSLVLFQYYPGHGLQLQPLGNFGAANGYWSAHKDEKLRTLLEELSALRVSRGSFSAWEYYFRFGGGSPPWVSGMAQATAAQAYARAGSRLADPLLIEIGRGALGAFDVLTPLGARVPAGAGAWYALYSFDPQLQVLNAMLQSLIGLKTYADITGDTHALALFDQGNGIAQARIGSYDTGAWSLYSRSSTRPGAEADLNYHTLNRDFARRLCRLTGAQPYCDAADRFTRYLREDPRLDPYGPAPAPARAGRGVKFRFTLSKLGRVGVTVSAGGRTYLSTSAFFSRGKHYLRWVPPRLRNERTYDYRISARDPAGNTASVAGTIRVKGAKS
jgi:D-glucuronyl C5-epimerase C-terminus